MKSLIALSLLTAVTLSCALRASDKVNKQNPTSLASDMQVAKVDCKIFDRTPKKEFTAVAPRNASRTVVSPPAVEDPSLVKRELLLVGSVTKKIDLSDAQYYVHAGVYTGNFQIQVYDRKNQDYLAMAESAEHGFTSLSLLLKDPVVDVKCELLPNDPTHTK
jgi:hypothetical protein